MKDRTREAVFNLVGPAVKQKHAIDLFAGTGALGIEAISRGAARATLIERHFPTARMIRDSIRTLGIESVAEVVSADTFVWARRISNGSIAVGDEPWLVFCSPPFDFYVERADEMLQLIRTMTELAPPGSLAVVEADERFDVALLPHPDRWDVRQYAPAVVALLH